MFFRFAKSLAAAILAASISPALANAECIRISPKQLLNAPGSEVVFAGDVVEVTRTGEFGSKATFTVRGVWKGKVFQRFEVFMWDLSAEAPRYEAGKSYVVAAQNLVDKRRREGVGLGDSQVVAFTGLPCSDLLSVEEFVRAAGGGKPPIDEAVQKEN